MERKCRHRDLEESHLGNVPHRGPSSLTRAAIVSRLKLSLGFLNTGDANECRAEWLQNFQRLVDKVECVFRLSLARQSFRLAVPRVGQNDFIIRTTGDALFPLCILEQLRTLTSN